MSCRPSASCVWQKEIWDAFKASFPGGNLRRNRSKLGGEKKIRLLSSLLLANAFLLLYIPHNLEQNALLLAISCMNRCLDLQCGIIGSPLRNVPSSCHPPLLLSGLSVKGRGRLTSSSRTASAHSQWPV